MSTYEQGPVLNVGVVTFDAARPNFDTLLAHPRIHTLCTLKAAPGRLRSALAFEEPYQFTHRLNKFKPSTLATKIVIVSNAAGTARYLDCAQLGDVERQIRQAPGQLLDWSPPPPGPQTAVTGRRPQPPRSFTKAVVPPPFLDNHARQQALPTMPTLRAVLLHQPVKRFDDWKQLVYTDGSKPKEGPLAAAVVHPATNLSVHIELTGHDGQIDTAVRAELAAILHAVRHVQPDQDIVILTDCMTAIWNLIRMLEQPEHFRVHKHKHLISYIVQKLRMQTRRVTILKVRAHAGMAGNEMADKVATGALAATQSCSDDSCPDAGRGTAWLQYTHHSGESVQERDVDTLNHHALSIAETTYHEKVWDGLSSSPANLLRRIYHTVQDQGGIDALVSTHHWKKSMPEARRRFIIQVMTNRLWTAHRKRRYDPAGTAVNCPHCGNAADTPDHRLNRCSFPARMRIITERHHSAVRHIAEAVEHNGCYLYTDAVGMTRPEGAPQRYAHQELLPRRLQTSIPDIMLWPTLLQHTWSATDLRRMSPAVRGGHTVYVFELKYAEDTRLHDSTLREASAQHAPLCAALRQHGWKVEMLPFVIGNVGTMRAENADMLQRLGVPVSNVFKLLSTLASESLEFSHRVWLAHSGEDSPSARRRQQTHRTRRNLSSQHMARASSVPAVERDSDEEYTPQQENRHATSQARPTQVRLGPKRKRPHRAAPTPADVPQTPAVQIERPEQPENAETDDERPCVRPRIQTMSLRMSQSRAGTPRTCKRKRSPSPTVRKSTRRRKDVDYDAMHNGDSENEPRLIHDPG